MSFQSLLGRRSLLRMGQRRQVATGRRRLFSSNEVAVEEAGAVTPSTPPLVTRHGPGDGVVTLNVGGKEFITLRSTIQLNSVLHTRVVQAEANQEFTKGAVFIDRDPAFFPLILQQLRNRAELNTGKYSTSTGMSGFKSSLVAAKKKLYAKKDVLIDIPKDKDAVRALYVEARFYQIQELEALLCQIDWFTQVANWFGGSGTNPFYAATQAITTARRALVASSGLGLVLGTQNEELMNNVKGLFSDVAAILWGGKPEDSESNGTEPEKPMEPSFS